MANIGNLTGNVPATQLQSTSPGTSATGSPSWLNFRFQNPTSPFQQNFNSLAGQDPNAAFSYGFTGRAGGAANSNDLRRALDAAGYNGAGVLGAYNRGSFDPTSGMGQSIGMPADWQTPAGSLDRSGGSFTLNGKSYALQNPEAAANTSVGYNGGGGANAPGGSSWWDAVKNFQTTQGGPPATAGGATPAGGATVPANNVGQSDQSGSIGGLTGQGTTTPASNFNEAAGNYTGGMKLSDYLNPATDWAQQQGLKGLQSTYAANGMLNSGSAMKGISDYMTNSTLNNAWQPAFNNYMNDKNFNYGVDTGDRNFNYQAQMNDQTIPWQQQMQLAQLGMQGAGGQSNINNLLATLLSQNALSAGQTGASGTIGGSNAINNALSQYLSQYLSQQYLNKIPGQG